jgi:SpoOM protein
MGFLDRLRGGGTTLAVTLDQPEAAPGGAITVRVDVSGELDDKARAIRVGLTGTGRYLVEERRRDSQGHVNTDQEWRSVDLHEEEHEYPAKIGPLTAEFTLPPDAPPSAVDAVEWEVYARVDRERGMDKKQEQPLAVRMPTDRLPSARTPAASDDGLTLDDVPVAARAGDQLSGALTVNVPKDLDVTAVRIRLHRRCTYVADRIDNYSMFRGDMLSIFAFGGSQSHITRDEKVAEADLSGKRSFSAGQVEHLPFAIAVPASLGGTTGHPYAQVDWRLEAVLDRRMRDDLAVSVPLAVY